MSELKNITSYSEWEKEQAAAPTSALVIISFHAPWAAPCAQMKTVIETLARDYPVTEPPSTLWFSIDAEELSEISDTYDVTAVPCLILVRGGQVVETVCGSSAVKVRTAIEAHTRGDAAGSSHGGVTNGLMGKPGDEAAPQQSDVDAEKQKENLQKRLGDLVKAAPVMLFMKGTPSSPQCGFSRQVVAILREKSVKYGFFNILADDEVRQGLKEFADWPTYPQLWIDGELVGGLDIIKDEMANDADFFKAYSVGTESTAA